MRIVKQGQKPEDQLFRGTCGRCFTIYECYRKDGKYVSAQRDGDFLHVTCPYCGNANAVAYPIKAPLYAS